MFYFKILKTMTYYMSLYFFLFHWSIVDLQYFVSFRYTAKWFSYTCFLHILFHFRLLHNIAYSSLCYAVIPCSIQFSHSVMSDSLWPHERQHARPPCPSPTPGVYPNSCPLSQWCHPTMLSSVIPFSSCLQSFPASGSFLMSQIFASGGQVLELQLQRQSFQWIFRTDFLSDWSPCTPRDSQESSPTAQFKTINSLVLSFLYGLNRTNVWTVWQNKVLIFLYTLENFWDPTLIKKKKMPFCLSSTYSFLGVLVGSEWYSRVYRPSDFDAKVQD